MHKGAQPTDTARAILSYTGVLFKDHLHRGVVIGKLTQEQADAKFDNWKEQKIGKITAKQTDIAEKNREIAKNNLALELKAKEANAEAVRIKNTPPPEPVAEVAPAAAEEAAPSAEAAPENPAPEANDATPPAEA